MAVGVSSGIILGGWQMPEMTLQNLHPKDLPIWPLMFITVACGATSGFHAHTISTYGTLHERRKKWTCSFLWCYGC